MSTLLHAGVIAGLLSALLFSIHAFGEDSPVPQDKDDRNVRSEPAKVRFVQDRFAIGFWVAPPADEKMEERYKEIAQAHFTFVMGGFGQATVGKQLALCEKFGLKALVEDRIRAASPEKLSDSPACWGYGLMDEPGSSNFPGLRGRVDRLRASDPGRLGFINLFPNYAPAWALGTSSYDEHVSRFVAEVDPDVLCMDHYPIFKPGADGRAKYCENLEVMRKYSLKANIPFWNFFNTMPYGPHTDPTEGQIRWQVYTSLAYGAKGILYFCYYTPPRGHEFPKGGAIIARDDRRTRHYDQALRINAAVLHLGPTLMKLTSTAVCRLAPDTDPAKVLAGTCVKSIARSKHDPPHDYLIGIFRHTDGRRAVMLNNYRFAYTAWPTVEFDADHGKVVEVDKRSGKERPVVDDSPDMEGLQLSLDSGEGRLFILP